MTTERDLQTPEIDDHVRLRYRVNSLELKLTLLMAVITVLVVGGITYLANQLTLEAVERYLTRTASEVAETLAARLESGFPEPQILQEMVSEYVLKNAEVEAIAVFSPSSSGQLQRVAAAGVAVSSFGEQQRAFETRTSVSRRVTMEEQRLWSLGVPVGKGERTLGVVGVWSSLLAADLVLQQNRRRAFVAAPLSVALIVLMLRLVFNRIVHQPLRDLEHAMLRAEAGNLRAEVPVVRRDELGLIAARYNNMLARIRNIIEERKGLHDRVQRFNEELEAKVTESTRELQDKNRELRRLNEELYYLQRRLPRIERISAAQQMASKFAHKIGTPLNLISGHIQMLQQSRQEDEELGQKLILIQSQIEKLTTTVRDILDETRKPVLDLEPIKMNQLFDRICALVEPTFVGHGILMERQLSPELGSVLGDETQLEQAFLNLLNNSLDAMPEGGIITVRTEQRRGKIWVELSDNGEGIRGNVLPQIFRPFFTTKEIGRGTGLGLAIVKEILTAHGASIVAESGTGVGTTFTMEFPLAVQTPAEVSQT